MATVSDEVWEERSPGRLRRWRTRLRDAAHVRMERAGHRWTERARSRRSTDTQGTGAGPSFAIGSYEASFDELEAIVFHPHVLAAIEQPPRMDLAEVELGPARLPRGAEQFGWSPRHGPAKVYDLVPLGLELDLLELRLLELHDLVDIFIVVEAPRSYGGLRKPLFLDRNRSRFARFHDKLTYVVLDAEPIDLAYPSRRRTATDFLGEDAFRAAMWRAVRRQVAFEPDAVVLASDLDEFPPRNFVYWLRHYAAALPLRLRLPTLRYQFGLRDTETNAEMVVLSPDHFAAVDAQPHRLRLFPGRTFGALGAVHLTSFLHPLALIAKFAMSTDWDPGILPFLRNEHGETASMISDGRWFTRRLEPYDAASDPTALIPAAAKANRHRYPRFWPVTASGLAGQTCP